MSTVNHDARDPITGVILFFAERAIVFVKKFVDEFIDFFAIEIRRILGLLEEKCGRVLKLLH